MFEFDTVRLTVSTEHRRKGEIGCIVDIHGAGEAYTIEFRDDDAQGWRIETVQAGSVVKASPITKRLAGPSRVGFQPTNRL